MAESPPLPTEGVVTVDGPGLVCSKCQTFVELDRAIDLGAQGLFGCPNCEHVEFWDVPATEARRSTTTDALFWDRIRERRTRPGNGSVPGIAT